MHPGWQRRSSSLRPLLWLAAGLLVLPLAVLAIAPELGNDLGALSGWLAPVLLAGIPGIVLLVVYGVRLHRSQRGRGEVH